MPFGPDCEYKEWSDCTSANSDKEDPDAYCAKIQDSTEDHCKKQQSRARGDGAALRRFVWEWDAEEAAYRAADGDLVSQPVIRQLLGQFLDRQQNRADQITNRLLAGELTVPEWEQEMRFVLKDAFGGAFMLGRGGRLQMESRDWGRVGNLVRFQYEKLNGLAAEMAAGSLSKARVAQRAALYPRAARQAQSRGWTTALGAPLLPAHPGDGSTECYGNCGCWWELEQITQADGSRGWEATWVRSKTDSCATCVRREQEWAPLVLQA